MKYIRFESLCDMRLCLVLICLVLMASFGAASLCGQTTPPAPAGTWMTPETARKIASTRTVLRPPASIMPSAQARLSTAQRVAALGNQPPMKELPGFTVTDRDGHAVTTKALSKSAHWILVYRKQSCLPCDRLMRMLAADESGGLKGGQPYVVVVSGKERDAVDRVRANYSTLSEATWLADKDKQAYAALKPRGAPMIYAMDGSRIAWNVPGNLGNPAKVEQMAAAWISSGSTSAAASTATVPASASTAAASTTK